MGKDKKTNTRKWFDRWSNEYDRTLGSIGFHKQILDLMVKNSGAKSRDKVLDIGCGTGLLSLKFLQRTGCSIMGIDNSEDMLGIFRDKIKKLRLEGRIVCRLMDADKMDFKDNSFDVIASSVTLHHLREKLNFLKKARKILKPGGRFLIGEVSMDTTGHHSDPKRLGRILVALEQEWIPAMKDAGIKAFTKMYENGIRHIFNQGEYCLSFEQWAALCGKAGFKKVRIKRVKGYKGCFGAVVAFK